MQLRLIFFRMVGTFLFLQTLTGCKKDEQLDFPSFNSIHKPIITDALSELFPYNNKAIVVIRCKAEIMEKEKWYYPSYRISEIWRDESDGLFTNKVGDLAPNIGDLMMRSYKTSSSVPQKDVIILLGYDDEGLRLLLTSYINIDRILGESSGIGGNVKRVKHYITTTTSSKEKIRN